jgi:DNA-binding NarL/FixJ family response regulator
MTVVLSAGHDHTLLAIRNMVLAQSGYKVVSAATAVEFIDRFFDGDFDLVILCHTIPEDERRRMADIVHQQSPSTPVVVLSDGTTNPSNYATATVAADVRDLLQALPTVLGTARAAG